MPEKLYIGVDGGATKCIVRVENEHGKPLGQAVSGPANIRLSVPQAWQSIEDALEMVLKPYNINYLDKKYELHAGMGLAGCEVAQAYQSFVTYPHKFTSLAVTNDPHTACLGAHTGSDGAIIIAGTGVVGYQIENGIASRVSGWGFPHDDIGSGAWLGLEAARIAFQAEDGRIASSSVANAVLAHFDNNLDRFVAWANQANSTAYAELAPVVVQQAKAGDDDAIGLLKAAAHALDAVASALQVKRADRSKPLPLALIGGISKFVQPYLSQAVQSRLVSCELPPEAGAIFYARQQLAQQNRESA